MSLFLPPHELKTPVLFLVFNRPDTTKKVFDEIRNARPPRLYVGADGARKDHSGEAQLVDEVRRIATSVDWPCEVRTLFHHENIGCRDAVAGAISWFFANEEAGIILEDDCLPSQSFFWFCEAMLERYHDDMRIGQVSGYNASPKIDNFCESTYLFSSYGSIWGWATWRSRWAFFRPTLSVEKELGLLEFALNSLPEDEYPFIRRQQFKKVVEEQRSIWDYQWFLARLANSFLSIVPKENLINNIGFGVGATHTFQMPNFAQPPLGETPIPPVDPSFILRDRHRDLSLLNASYAHRRNSLTNTVVKRCKRLFSRQLLRGRRR